MVGHLPGATTTTQEIKMADSIRLMDVFRPSTLAAMIADMAEHLNDAEPEDTNETLRAVCMVMKDSAEATLIANVGDQEATRLVREAT
jgi:hypothetical protein